MNHHHCQFVCLHTDTGLNKVQSSNISDDVSAMSGGPEEEAFPYDRYRLNIPKPPHTLELVSIMKVERAKFS